MTFFLLLFYIYGFILAKQIVIIDTMEIRRLKNNILRVYVTCYPKSFRKEFIYKLNHCIKRYSEKINLYLFDINAKYYSLTEDDRTIIETVISLGY